MTEIGVLFTYYKENQTVQRNYNSFKKDNPDIAVFPLCSNVPDLDDLFCWRNVDLLYYKFYRENKHKCRRWLLAEWDVFCNCNLEGFFGETWDHDFVCNQHVVFGDKWKWFEEVGRVPKKFWRNLHGICPLACTLVSDEMMSRISSTASDLDFDLFCEFRLGILASYCGASFTVHSSDTVAWREKLRKKFDFGFKSLWHPVKG